MNDSLVNNFRGIRYANSTAGANRWMPPTAPSRSPTIASMRQRRAVRALLLVRPGFSAQQPLQRRLPLPQCYDTRSRPFRGVTTNCQSWIFMPWRRARDGSAGAQFDPSVLVSAHKIIVVTLNYRLGALGWLAHRALDGTMGSPGNYGLMDQQLAFKWVRDNIQHFPVETRTEVTIGSESAGGFSTDFLIWPSPTAKGLFHAAIVRAAPHWPVHSFGEFAAPGKALWVEFFVRNGAPAAQGGISRLPLACGTPPLRLCLLRKASLKAAAELADCWHDDLAARISGRFQDR